MIAFGFFNVGTDSRFAFHNQIPDTEATPLILNSQFTSIMPALSRASLTVCFL
jgi:hypothetical protein